MFRQGYYAVQLLMVVFVLLQAGSVSPGSGLFAHEDRVAGLLARQ
jgi:hypothetical protein